MSAILNRAVSRMAPVLRTTLTQKASFGMGSGPPRVAVSFQEKMAMGLVLSIGVCVPSGYFIMQIRHYRGHGAKE